MSRCIILIVIDCLRADHVSCYGYHRPTTPTIDALAEKGILWSRAHSASSWTKPSMATLFTGLHPCQHGVFLGIKRSKNRTAVTTDALPADATTLAEVFSRSGWRCGGFMNNVQLDDFTGLGRGFETYVPVAGKIDRLLEQFGGWLKQDSSSPIFGYLHFQEAHWPYKPRRRHMALFGGDREKNYFRDFSARDYGRLRRGIERGEQTLSSEQLAQMVQMYDAAVRRLDGRLKIVLQMLEELGLDQETALVITADHGEEFMEHGCIGHGHALYNELTHVPLIVRLPAGPQGIRREQPVGQVNLAATLLSIAGLNADLPGRDLMRDGQDPHAVHSELRIQRRYTQTIQTDAWKLHRRYKFEVELDDLNKRCITPQWMSTAPLKCSEELYDMRRDHGEQRNLADDADCRRYLLDLRQQLDQWWQQTGSPQAPAAGDVEIDQQVVQRLRDLGYID